MADFLLTIAIPTFNRAAFLALGLARLRVELASVPPGMVEIVVSDNASTDATAEIIAAAARDIPLRAIRNPVNLGADRNTAQCFDVARGRYVLILGDDDLFVRGALARIIALLRHGDYGVVCLQPFGYDSDPDDERPIVAPDALLYDDAGAFLIRCGALITFISACIVQKSLLPGFSARRFCGGHLVQMHAVLRASLAARANLFVPDYLIACKRNNSGGYDFAAVFVEEFGSILDFYGTFGLSQATVAAIEQRMIAAFHPAAIMRRIYHHDPRLPRMATHYRRRFDGRLAYHVILAPLFSLPRRLALVWGFFAVIGGRLQQGDLPRGMRLLRSKLRHWLV